MNSEIHPKVSEMLPDVAVARSILDDTFDLTPGRRSIVIGLAIAGLKRIERALSPDVLRERPRLLTERRVRSIVDNEARRIDAYEIEDLQKLALAEARLDFQRSTDRAARLASFLAHRDPSFHGPEIEYQLAMARGVHGAGNQGVNDGSGRDRAGSDHQQQLARGVGRAGNQHHRTGGDGR